MASTKKTILYLHKYGRKAASYRYRFELYFEKLKAEGFSLQSQSLFNDHYLEKLYQNRYKPWGNVLFAYFKRILYLLFNARSDLKIVYMELFPGLPFFFEKLFLKPNSYILEMDDAYFLNCKNKSAKLIKNAKAVIVGSHFLNDFALKHNANVILIPTVVDLSEYHNKKVHSQGPVCIGWIGSPSTATELKSLQNAFQRLEANSKVRFLFIGAPEQELGLANCEYREWSEDRQMQDIYEMDIGLMPLEDTAWNRGKCGFKLIQYMAAGIPVVCSPVGENSHIVDEGKSGYYAQAEDQWYGALARLAESVELRQTIGEQAAIKIQQKYSLNAVFDSYLALMPKALRARI